MKPRTMTPTVRAYRALLVVLLPTGFNDAFADDMLDVFVELDRATRATHGHVAAVIALCAELPGLFRLAVRERRTRRTIRAHQATTHLEENVFDSIIQDLAFAIRSLRRAPAFALTAILTLALGVGANTAIFSLVNGVLLTPLRLREPDRMIAVGEYPKGSPPNTLSSTSPGSFFDWQTRAKTMHVAGYAQTQGVLTEHGEPQQLTGASSVGGLMDVLGVQPLFGRLLTIGDEDPASPLVIMLSFETWHRLFGDDRSILGKTINLNGTARTIVGVMPAGFSFPGAPNDFWAPTRYDAAYRANRDQYFVSVVGRLASTATVEQARTEMNAIGAELARDWPKYNADTRLVVQPLKETIVGGARSQLLVLMGAVAFVLLITCANLGNLLLARASGRRREIAVRQALGANRSRVARQLLTESVLLSLVGGCAGLVVGKSFLKMLLAAQGTLNLPRADEISLDGRVLVFTLVVAVMAGLVFGSIPAWQLSGSRSSEALREGTRGSGGNQWTRSALVVSELALAMVLLTGAGLLLRSFDLLRRVNPGVRTEGVVTFSASKRGKNPTFFPATIEQIRALPGVQSAALVSQLPISGRGIGAWFNRIDRPLPDGVHPTGEAYRVVTPEYFATVGQRLTLGRLLETSDRLDAPGVVVNQALVKKYYPGENPIGKEIYLGAPDNRLFDHAAIVGVVADTRDLGLGSDAVPTIYAPYALMPYWPAFSYVVRTTGSSTATIISSSRAIIHAADPGVPVRGTQTLDDVLSAAVAPARWSAVLLGAFAMVALIMAVLGVFGVLSFIVTQRTRELGIRIALGASNTSVQGLVVGRGMLIVVAGLGVGLLGALALSRFMTSLLYGVTPTDPATYVGVGAVLLAAAALASYLPARRATRVDPIIALRAES
jgi:putative ABC transport system permease protein